MRNSMASINKCSHFSILSLSLYFRAKTIKKEKKNTEYKTRRNASDNFDKKAEII